MTNTERDMLVRKHSQIMEFKEQEPSKHHAIRLLILTGKVPKMRPAAAIAERIRDQLLEGGYHSSDVSLGALFEPGAEYAEKLKQHQARVAVHNAKVEKYLRLIGDTIHGELASNPRKLDYDQIKNLIECAAIEAGLLTKTSEKR